MASLQKSKYSAKFLILFHLFAVGSAWASEPVVLKAAWQTSGAVHSLKSWTLKEFSQLKTSSTAEKDPTSGQLVRWKGVLVSKWIEKELADLPLDQRSQVDLLIFKNNKGQQAIIPRYLLNKYPVLLGFERNGKNPNNNSAKDYQPGAQDGATLTVVIPWTSRPKIHEENLPLEAYQISGVTEVAFSNFETRFNSLLLKRRTDPAAIRGEKMIVQNCVGCHGNGRARSVPDLSLGAAFGHPEVNGVPKLNTRDLRALVSYMTAYQSENQVGQQVGSANSNSLKAPSTQVR
jgi:mono/diheme cytochrome c family protein